MTETRRDPSGRRAPIGPPGPEERAAARRLDPRVAVLALAVTAAAPLLWFTHLAAMYALVPTACRVGSDAPFHVATAVALLGLAICSIVALRLAPDGPRRTLVRRMLTSGPADQDRSVPALVAAAMAVYFLLVAAMTGLAPLLVDRCA